MSHSLYLLDTNVILALVRGNELGIRIDTQFGLRSSKVRPEISIVTHGEVRVLAARNGWGAAKLEALQNALRAFITVDVNEPDVIDAYVQIDLYSQRHPNGARNMGKNDLWIAACAKASGATLLTTDKDFDHIEPNLLRSSTSLREHQRRMVSRSNVRTLLRRREHTRSRRPSAHVAKLTGGIASFPSLGGAGLYAQIAAHATHRRPPARA